MWHDVKIMNYETGEMRKEGGCGLFDVTSAALPRDTEEKHEHPLKIFCTRRDFEPDPSINANYITPSTCSIHAR
jgi:hypothetical protein